MIIVYKQAFSNSQNKDEMITISIFDEDLGTDDLIGSAEKSIFELCKNGFLTIDVYFKGKLSG